MNSSRTSRNGRQKIVTITEKWAYADKLYFLIERSIPKSCEVLNNKIPSTPRLTAVIPAISME